jgi:PTS system nitrogen regulatory IIA component
MSFADLFTDQGTACRLRCHSKKQVLWEVAVLLSGLLGVEADAVIHAVTEGERAQSSASKGVALWHVTVPGLNAIRAVCITLEHSVSFAAVDDLPVDIVCVLCIPPGMQGSHLRLLAEGARLTKRPRFRRALRGCTTPEALLALLSQGEEEDADGEEE